MSTAVVSGCVNPPSNSTVPPTQDSVEEKYFQRTIANHLAAYPAGEMLHSQPACVCV